MLVIKILRDELLSELEVMINDHIANNWVIRSDVCLGINEYYCVMEKRYIERPSLQ